MSRRALASLLFAALGLLAAAESANALTVRVEPQAVVASGVTRGGSAVVFGIAYDVAGAVPTRERIAIVVRDDDQDGVVRYEPPQGVPRIGIWGVVDLATGAAQLSARPGYRLVPFADPLEEALRGERGAGIERLERQSVSAEMLVVRPGAAAWSVSATEGGENDGDGVLNGNLVVPVDRLVALTPGTTAPARLQAGDVVLLIDADDMRAAIATVSERN